MIRGRQEVAREECSHVELGVLPEHGVVCPLHQELCVHSCCGRQPGSQNDQGAALPGGPENRSQEVALASEFSHPHLHHCDTAAVKAWLPAGKTQAAQCLYLNPCRGGSSSSSNGMMDATSEQHNSHFTESRAESEQRQGTPALRRELAIQEQSTRAWRQGRERAGASASMSRHGNLTSRSLHDKGLTETACRTLRIVLGITRIQPASPGVRVAVSIPTF